MFVVPTLSSASETDPTWSSGPGVAVSVVARVVPLPPGRFAAAESNTRVTSAILGAPPTEDDAVVAGDGDCPDEALSSGTEPWPASEPHAAAPNAPIQETKMAAPRNRDLSTILRFMIPHSLCPRRAWLVKDLITRFARALS